MTSTIDHMPAAASSPVSSADPPREDPVTSDGDGPTWSDFRDLERRVQERANRRDAWTMAIWLFSAVAVLFAIVAIGLGSRAVDESRKNTRLAGASAASQSAAPAPAASPVAVTLSDMRVVPASTTIAAGQVTLRITNTGAMPHELLVFRSDLAPAAYPMKDGDIDEEGPGITKVSDGENLDPGASQTRVVDFSQPGTYLLVCNLPGHFKMGMYRQITVK